MGKFTLGLSTAKNTDHIEKCFKQKLRRIKFPKKKFVERASESTPEVAQEGFKD